MQVDLLLNEMQHGLEYIGSLAIPNGGLWVVSVKFKAPIHELGSTFIGQGITIEELKRHCEIQTWKVSIEGTSPTTTEATLSDEEYLFLLYVVGDDAIKFYDEVHSGDWERRLAGNKEAQAFMKGLCFQMGDECTARPGHGSSYIIEDNMVPHRFRELVLN